MQSIKVSILGKSYPLRVEEDQAEAMQEIAQYVDQLFREYRTHLKNQPESTAMVLSCLRIAEELHQTRTLLRKAIEEQEKSTVTTVNQENPTSQQAAPSEAGVSDHEKSELESELFALVNKRIESVIELAQKTVK